MGVKVGIIFLTDIHLTTELTWLNDKIQMISNAIKTDFENCSKIYIAITGDLTQSSQQKEYSKLETLLSKLKSFVKFLYEGISINFIIIPGNHDCNFSYDSQLRKNQLPNINYDSIGKDNSVLDLCLVVQKDFWDYYEKLNGTLPDNRIFYQIEDNIENKSIIFNCLNTSWMSTEKESIGSLFYPVKNINQNIKKGDISITLLHHPLNWFTTKTTENNSYEMRVFIDKISDVVLLAHEHIDDSYSKTQTGTQKETYYRHGSALYNYYRGTHYSGFKTMIIDLDNLELTETQYNWDNNLYNPCPPLNINLKISGEEKRHFVSKDEFIATLEHINLPISISKKNGIKQSNLYVFPDLDNVNSKRKDFNNYFDSEKLTDENQKKIIILEGENQAGKTTLLNMLYLKFRDKKQYPILIRGEELKKLDIDKLIEKKYIQQYTEKRSFEEYRQFNNEHKVLLIDNIDESPNSDINLREILLRLNNRFDRIIITVNPLFANFSIFETFNDSEFYKILPLGFKKRNKLIDIFHSSNYETHEIINEQDHIDNVKKSFDEVQVVLGNKLIPSFPIFILSILQTLQEAKPINTQQTSYGFCYQALITNGLLLKASVPAQEIDTYMNFITELAYNMYELETDTFSEELFLSFYRVYSDNYIINPFNEVKKTLSISLLFTKNSENEYKFCYDYINYFLAARKISQLLYEDEGKKILRTLCKNIHDKKSANILIFIAHHTKSQVLIEETTLTSMVPFEDTEPVTLEKSDPYFTLLNSIVKDLCDDIFDINRKPSEERERVLSEIDLKEKELQEVGYEDPQTDEEVMKSQDMINLFQALRALEIVGQIIKNGKGSIDKKQLAIMIEELYYTGFRIISFFGKLSINIKDDILNAIEKNVDQNDSKNQVEKKVTDFFQSKALFFCLSIFAKIIHSVGSKELRQLYDEVSNKIDTPASKLVTFGIKLYYSKLSTEELKKLADEFSNNQVAFEILKSNVRYYVYNNQITYKERQIIESKLKVQFLPALRMNNPLENK